MSFITTDPAIREAFITGLRELADFLASNPVVCVPSDGTEITLTADSADGSGCEQVNSFALQLGITACDDLADIGLYWSGRFFGTVGYVMSAAPDNWIASHRTEASDSDCVTPDAHPDTWT